MKLGVLFEVQDMTYANVDLIPLMRIHLEVSDPLLPI